MNDEHDNAITDRSILTQLDVARARQFRTDERMAALMILHHAAGHEARCAARRGHGAIENIQLSQDRLDARDARRAASRTYEALYLDGMRWGDVT
jgi:hypothetical protein